MRGRPFSLCHSPSEVPMDCRLAASAGGQNRQQAHPGPAASLTSFGSSFNHLQVSKQLTQVANTVSPGCLGDSFSHLEIKPPVMTEAAQCPTVLYHLPASSNDSTESKFAVHTATVTLTNVMNQQDVDAKRLSITVSRCTFNQLPDSQHNPGIHSTTQGYYR